ncbi:MAG: HRDC domain-containing protein [Lewinellaceae bacterium]|nr:HRDC domain-containing protein [Lewinellaceae bacterium]
MQIKIISVPVVGGEAINEDLNAFLRGRKILEVEQQLVDKPGGACWTFCIRYVEQKAGQQSNTARQRKDYKQILSKEAFDRFSRYRVIRKQVSEKDGVPPFAVFSDKELAGLAELEKLTPASMKTVKGIGDRKVEKYADRFMKAMSDEESE